MAGALVQTKLVPDRDTRSAAVPWRGFCAICTVPSELTRDGAVPSAALLDAFEGRMSNDALVVLWLKRVAPQTPDFGN